MVQSERSVEGIEYDTTFANEAVLHLDHVVNADLNLLNWRQTFADRNFDCIIFADVLEHLIDPKNCLQQALEHLQPSGCLVVSLPNIRHISALRAVWFGGRFPQRDRGIFDRTHLRWFTVMDAHCLLTDSGLKVSSINLALRWGDQPGGRLNRLLNRLPKAVKAWAPVREFLTYQVCLRAEVA
jgi:SAM-dependent methyltransferase